MTAETQVTAETLTVLPKPPETESLGHEQCPQKSQFCKASLLLF